MQDVIVIMNDIQHKLTEQDGEYSLQITVSSSKVEEILNAIAKDIAATANIPGFRHGTAPPHIVRQHYSSQIKTKASLKLVQSATRNALDESGLSAGARPTIMPQFRPNGLKKWLGIFDLGGGFTFGISFRAPPSLQEINIDCISVDTSSYDPEQIIAEQIHHLRHDLIIKTPSSLPSTELDEIVCSIEATDAMDKTIDELSLVDFPMSLDLQKEGLMSRELAKQLLGRVPGDIIHFSEDNIKYKITISQVNCKSLPALDDSLAQRCGLDSIEDLREKIHEEWYMRNASRIRKELHLKARTQLVEANQFEVPPEWIKEYKDKTGSILKNNDESSDKEEQFAKIYAASDYILELIETKYPDQVRLTDKDISNYAREEVGVSGIKSEDYIRAMIAKDQYEAWVMQQKKTKTLDWLILRSKSRAQQS